MLTIGIPPEFRERATELNSKLKIQGESIEGLRAMNEKLASQMVKLEGHNMELEEKISKIEEEQARIRTQKSVFDTLMENDPETQKVLSKLIKDQLSQI